MFYQNISINYRRINRFLTDWLPRGDRQVVWGQTCLYPVHFSSRTYCSHCLLRNLMANFDIYGRLIHFNLSLKNTFYRLLLVGYKFIHYLTHDTFHIIFHTIHQLPPSTVSKLIFPINF